MNARQWCTVAAAIAACGGACEESTGVNAAFLVVAPDSVTLPRRDSMQLSVAVLDRDSVLLTGVAVRFASSDTLVVTVSATGLVRSRGPIDTATITISGAGLTTHVPVRVFGIPAAIEVSPADTAIRQGRSVQLVATVVDAAGDPIPDQSFEYQSSHPGIVTVSPSGLVTSAGPYGSATVVVRSGSITGIAAVSVIDSQIVARLRVAGRPFGIAVNGAGTAYVTQLDAARLARIDLPAAAVSASVLVGSVPTNVTFDHGGSTAYVTNQFSGTVGVVAVGTNVQTSVIPVTGGAGYVRVSPDGQILWVTTTADSVYGIGLPSRNIVRRYGTPSISNGIAFHPTNDSLVYVGIRGGSVQEINFERDSLLRTFATGGTTQAIAVALDGSELYVAQEFPGEMRVYSIASGALTAQVPLPGGAFDLQLSPDGSTIWIGVVSGWIYVVDRGTRATLRTVFTGGVPRRIAFAPANGPVLVANEYGWVDFVGR